VVQAARSGKQNIAEGSMASGTSKKTELKLVGIARASLDWGLRTGFQFVIRKRVVGMGLPQGNLQMPRRATLRPVTNFRVSAENSHVPPQLSAGLTSCQQTAWQRRR
jgi:hypothetical protein